MKEIKRMSLATIKSLSRKEMKIIMAGGSGSGGGGGGSTDCVHPACTPECATPSHPNSYCATTFCTRRDGTSTTFQSCQFY